jgi:hypothetical protein
MLDLVNKLLKLARNIINMQTVMNKHYDLQYLQ